MTDVSPATDDPYEAARAAKAAALQEELHALAEHDDAVSRARRYELHYSLIWQVWAMGTMRGQEQAEQAVTIARRLQDQRREAAALHAWARVYLAEHGDVTGDDVHPTQEESQAGQRLHEQALHIREQLLGPDHPDVAESLLQIVNQGRLWWPMQPYVEMVERAVQICERAFGPEHERTWAALEKQATFLLAQNSHTRALEIYEQLRAVYTRVFGPDERTHTQHAIAQIAMCHQLLGNNTAALALLRELVAQQRSTLGDHDMSVLSLIVQISDVLWKQGALAEADDQIAHALAQLEAAFDDDHPNTRAFLSQLGGHYQSHNDLAKARPIYERLLASYERMGSQDDYAVYTMTTLFTVLWQLGDIEGANALFDQLLLRCASPAPLIANLYALSFVRNSGGNTATASRDSAFLALYARLLAATEQKVGPDHPNVAAVLIAWAQRLSYDDEDDRATLIPMIYRALAIHPPALAAPDGELLRLIRNIDDALSGAGEYAAVRELYTRTYDLCTPTLGAEHPHMIDLQFRLNMLPDVRPTRTDSGAENQRPAIVQDDLPNAIVDNAPFVMFQSPANRAAIGQLRAVLTDGSDFTIGAAQTLDAAIASTAEVLLLILPDDRAVTLTDEQIARLQNRKVIGIGYGAAKVFAQLGLEIHGGICAHYGTMSMQLLVEPNQLAQLPGLGDPGGIAHSEAIVPFDHVGMHIPRTSQLVGVVDVIARVQFDPNYALIARQGHHILIGLAAPADTWTEAYADMFRAIAHALHSYTAQPFARAVWETVRPGVYSLPLGKKDRSTNADWSQEWHVRFVRPTIFLATLAITGSDSVMLIFMGEKKREHWTREDGSDGEVLNVTIDITEEDIRLIGDWYWILRVTNFDTEHAATCVLTIEYQA